MALNFLLALPFLLLWLLLVGVIGYMAVHVILGFLALVERLRDAVERWLVHRGGS